MNLAHEIGTRVREQIRETPGGTWQQVGRITIRRVREVVQALDPVRYEEWQTRHDERTCPICGQLDGLVWPAGEGFTPPAHDHCRCTRTYHHTRFRTRLIEQWRDTTVTTSTWEWRTS